MFILLSKWLITPFMILLRLLSVHLLSRLGHRSGRDTWGFLKLSLKSVFRNCVGHRLLIMQSMPKKRSKAAPLILEEMHTMWNTSGNTNSNSLHSELQTASLNDMGVSRNRRVASTLRCQQLGTVDGTNLHLQPNRHINQTRIYWKLLTWWVGH